jgi:SAM-dependent methyltransferase
LHNLEKSIADFYSNLNFPGPYSIKDLSIYDQDGVFNKFLAPYDDAVGKSSQVLDIGCGSGFISNLLAYRHKNVQITALDFSDSLDYAKNFAKENSLHNIHYHKLDFFEFVANKKFDCIISNGVLHHMPRYKEAIAQINSLLDNDGRLIVGLYNFYGKLFKKIIPFSYRNQLLYADQELVPFELTFKHKEVVDLFPSMELESVYPSYTKKCVDILNFFNYNNGGLTIYSFRKKNNA